METVKINYDIPKDLHTKLKTEASKEGKTLKDKIIERLEGKQK